MQILQNCYIIMLMKDTVNKILDSLGNGKAKTIQFTRGYDIERFLFEELKPAIKEELSNCLFFEFDSDHSFKKDIIPELSNIFKMSKGNRVIIFINDLFSFSSPEAIINVFFGKTNIDAVITTDIDIPFRLKRKDTQVRGRYLHIFLPPVSYGDDIISKDFHLQAIESLPSRADAAELYKFLLRNSGKPLSFRKIVESSGLSKSIRFCIDTIDYMEKAGMIYVLRRVDVAKMKTISSGIVFYPTFISDLDLTDLTYVEKYKLKNDAYLIAKMVSEGYEVARAISYNGGVIDGKYKSRIEIDRGFLIKCFDRKCIIRIDDGNEEEETRFKKMKCSIPQVIALLGEMELRVDDNGIAYYGLHTILKKGLNGYGGF